MNFPNKWVWEMVKTNRILCFSQHHLQEWGCQTRPNLNTVPLIISRAHTSLPSTCVLASPLALSKNFSFRSPSSHVVGSYFPCSFSLEIPLLAAVPSVSVLVAPALVLLPPSEPAQLSHKGLKEAKPNSQDRALLSWAERHRWFWKPQGRTLNSRAHTSRAHFRMMLKDTCYTSWVRPHLPFLIS